MFEIVGPADENKVEDFSETQETKTETKRE